MTITEFVEARIEEKISAAQSEVYRVAGAPRRNGKAHALREVRTAAAMRQILELHRTWPVLVQRPTRFDTVDTTDPTSFTLRASQQFAWVTQQEYQALFGDEPPAAPMVRALAAIWSDHPDFREDWRP